MAKAKLNIPAKTMTPAVEGGAIEKAVKDAGGSSTKMYRIPIDRIELIPGFNVRVDSDSYAEHRDKLVASIAANGFDDTKPLTGYVGKNEDGDNVIFVTDGHTRLDAVRTFNSDPDTKSENEITELPVVVRRDQPSMADLTVSLHTSNSGRPLTPYELGIVVERLLSEEGADKEDIARRLAVSPRYLDDVVLLAGAPVKIRNHVLRDEVSSTMAIQELRRNPEKAAERIGAAVEKAQGAGKKRATAKDVGPKLKRQTEIVEVPAGTNMKELVKAVAALVRQAIPAEGDGDEKAAVRIGEIKLTIGVEEEPKPVKAKPKKKAPAKKAKAEPEAEPAEKPAKAKPKKKKAPAKKAKSKSNDDAAREIAKEADRQAREEPEDEDNDLPLPPAVKSDASNDDVDI